MSRRHYLITYDVSDDKRRNRIFESLKDFGDHTQFSVFLCELDEAELHTLRGLLTPVVHAQEDQVLFVDLGPARNDLRQDISSIGRAFQPSTRAFIV